MFRSLDSFSMGQSSPINQIRNSGPVHAINDYMRSPWYVVLIAAMTALSSVMELELLLYSVFIMTGISFACLDWTYFR